jgi:hypothetical protein
MAWYLRTQWDTNYIPCIHADVILQLTISQPFHLSDICSPDFVMRRWVCNLLVQFAVTLWSKSRRIHDLLGLVELHLQSQSYLTTDGKSAGLSCCQGLWPIFLYPWNVLYAFAVEGGSVIYCCSWALPAQSLSGLGLAGLKDNILLSQFFKLSQPGWPGARIYIPQVQGGPVIPPGTGFPFRRLLRVAGLRWRYSNQSPHGESIFHNTHGMNKYNTL